LDRDEPSKAQIGDICQIAKVDNQRMAQELSHPTGSEMPEIPSPTTDSIDDFQCPRLLKNSI
jgi:hypothetical protein